jgi:hypothetical protein
VTLNKYQHRHNYVFGNNGIGKCIKDILMNTHLDKDASAGDY